MAADEKLTKALFSGERPSDPALLLEQYKVYLESAERISDRRQNANSFFLSINTALFALLGYLFSQDCDPAIRLFAPFAPVSGIILSIFWALLVSSYRQLNSAKFRILHNVEKRLPASFYDAEWTQLEEGRNPQKYRPLTHLEVWIPVLFIVLHVLILFLIANQNG